MHGLDDLPDVERRTRLRAGLANLIAKRGFDAFVTARLLEPTHDAFPDRWAPTKRGVKGLIRRLLWYAGLPDLHIELEVFDGRPDGESDRQTLAWFAGIAEGCVTFGLHVRQLDDRERLVGILCHEVAHAFRAHHGIVAADRDIEEALTDLTTVYLGFGIITVGASYAYRTRLIGASMIQGHESVDASLGYLSPAEMSYLLAIHTVVREATPSEVSRIVSFLPATQAKLFRQAHSELVGDLGLADEVGVPPRERWPERQLGAPVPFSDPEGEVSEDERIREQTAPTNTGRRVFRVRHTRRGVGMFMGVVASALPASAFAGSPALSALVVGAGAVIGAWMGATYVRHLCSDPGCGGSISADAAFCQRCGGRIAGELADAAERLAAEEALEEAERRARKP